MATNSAIEWTESTWNPITGCTKISPGCMHCYAERMALRLQAMGQANYAGGFKVRTHDQAVELPLSWKKPKTIFVNSMSDLFHKDIPFAFIQRVFDVMGRANWHQYQILTKRSKRLLELDGQLSWQPHIWMGVSVERQDYLSRIDDLRQTHAHTKFLSLEPLLGPLPNLDLSGIDWVIVGGESGPGPGRWTRNGPWRFATSARPSRCPSFSSSGAACVRAEGVGYFKGEPGMKCPGRSPRPAGMSWLVADVEVIELQLCAAAEAGKITNAAADPDAKNYVLSLVKVEAKRPIIKSENRMQEVSADNLLVAAGAMSKETMAAVMGRLAMQEIEDGDDCSRVRFLHLVGKSTLRQGVTVPVSVQAPWVKKNQEGGSRPHHNLFWRISVRRGDVTAH